MYETEKREADVAHEIDFNEAEQLGWEVVPRFEARKGDQVLRGTAAELSTRIAEHESREALHAEQLARAREKHRGDQVSKLVRRFCGQQEEHERAWGQYLDEEKHHWTRIQALDHATRWLERGTETLKKLFAHPKEALFENNDFLELQQAIRDATGEGAQPSPSILRAGSNSLLETQGTEE